MNTTINIQNLKCGGCVNTIKKNLAKLEAITEVTVNVEESTVSFAYPTEEKLMEVKEKLKTLGYPEDGEANSLGSKAKSYVSCAIGKMS